MKNYPVKGNFLDFSVNLKGFYKEREKLDYREIIIKGAKEMRGLDYREIIKWKREMKVFFYTLGNRVINLFWIVLGYIILSKFSSEKVGGVIREISRYKLEIVVALGIFFCIEYCIKYKKDFIKYSKSIIQYVYIILGICFLIESRITTGILNSWLITLIILMIGEGIIEVIYKKVNKKNTNSSLVESSNISYEELFESRKIQIDNIKSYIDNFDYLDRFTMLLNGNWGEGKTSIVNVLEEKMSENNKVIFIQPMMFDDKEKLIEYFLSSLKVILAEEKFYTGKGSSIEKYSKILISIVEKKAKLDINKLLDGDTKETFRDIKRALEKDIEKCSKRKKIIVIIDDFDRVSETTVKEILMFTREIIDFNGLNIIILAEYKKLIKVDSGISEKYLEKYIDKRFDLEDVRNEEVFKYFITKGVESLKDSEKIKNALKEFCENIDTFLIEVDDSIDKQLEKYDVKLSTGQGFNYDENKREEIKSQKESYEKFIIPLKDIKNNIRVIKKISREFIFAIKNLQEKNENGKVLDKVNLEIIFRFILFKNIMSNEYDNLLEDGSFEHYFSKNTKDLFTSISAKGIFLKNYFSIFDNNIETLENINRKKMLDALIYSKDPIYETQTSHEKLLSEIDSNLININFNANIYEVFDRYYSNVIMAYENNSADMVITKERMRILNEKLIACANGNERIVLFEIYKDLSRFSERHILNSSLIKDIHVYLKENQELNKLRKREITPYIEDIRRQNLGAMSSYVIILWKAIRGNDFESLESGIYTSLKMFNEMLLLLVSIKINEDCQFKLLKYNINNILENVECSECGNKLDMRYLRDNIQKFIDVEEKLMEFEKDLNENIINENIDLENVLEEILNYEEFIEISKEILEDILKKTNNLTYKDIRVCFSIVRKSNYYQNHEGNKSLYKLLQDVMKLMKANKDVLKSHYLSVQSLITSVEELKSKIQETV